jgi:hypothetical protein
LNREDLRDDQARVPDRRPKTARVLPHLSAKFQENVSNDDFLVWRHPKETNKQSMELIVRLFYVKWIWLQVWKWSFFVTEGYVIPCMAWAAETYANRRRKR